MVLMIHVDILTEVGLDALHTHIEQRLQQFALIPLGSFVVGEVDGAGIVEGGEIGSAACRGVFCFRGLADILILLGFFQLFGALGNVGQLPQRYLVAIVLQALDECLGVGETLGIELPLAEPVGTEPTRIEVNHVTGIMFLAKSVANLVHLVGREVGHTTHPDAERPERRHLRETCQHAIAAQNLLRCLATYQEHVEGGMVVEELDGTRGVVGQRELAVVRGMVETAIQATAHIERDVLIATTVVDTLSVLVLQLEGLSAKVHLTEALARAHEALVGSAFKTDGGALVVCRIATYETQGQGIIAGRREVVVAQGNASRLVTIGIKGDEGGGLRGRQQVAPLVKLGSAEVDSGHLHTVGCNDVVACGILTKNKGLALHLLRHHQHVVSLHHLVATHGGKQAEDVRLVSPDDEVERLLGR